MPEEQLLEFLHDSVTSEPDHVKKRLVMTNSDAFVKHHGILASHRDQVRSVDIGGYSFSRGYTLAITSMNVQARIEMNNGNILETAMVPLPIISKFKPSAWLLQCSDVDVCENAIDELDQLADDWKAIDISFNQARLKQHIQQDPLKELRQLLLRALKPTQSPHDRNIVAELFMKRNWIEVDSESNKRQTQAFDCMLHALEQKLAKPTAGPYGYTL